MQAAAEIGLCCSPAPDYLSTAYVAIAGLRTLDHQPLTANVPCTLPTTPQGRVRKYIMQVVDEAYRQALTASPPFFFRALYFDPYTHLKTRLLHAESHSGASVILVKMVNIKLRNTYVPKCVVVSFLQ